MNRIARRVGIILAIPILLILILVGLFYFPPFQNWAVRQVAAYASAQTGMEISVGHVSLDFPLNLGVDGVKVLQPRDSSSGAKDTIADVRHVVADVRLLPLLKGQVEIDELTFEDMKVNTAGLIHTTRIRAAVGRLSLKSHGIDLGESFVKLDEASFKNARISVELSDTVPEDTTPSTNFWKIQLDSVHFHQTDFTLHMPGDTLSVHAYMGNTTARDGFLDLHKGLYRVGKIDWRNGRLDYDNNFSKPVEGIDYSHLALNALTLKADSFSYCDSRLDINIRECSFREKSGLKIDRLEGRFALDSTSISLPDLKLRTPVSTLSVRYDMALDAFSDKAPGTLRASVHGRVGKQDMAVFLGSSAKKLMRRWPYYPLQVDGTVSGNMRKMRVSDLHMELPTAFRITSDGFIGNLDAPERLKADLDIDAQTYNIGFLVDALSPELKRQVRIPHGIGVKGHFNVDGQEYAGNFTATEGGGSLKGMARLDAARMAYTARLNAVSLPLQHFLPGKGLSAFTGYVEADGVGTDILSPRTRIKAKTRIQKFRYQGYSLDQMNAVATVSGGRIHADVDSKNSLLKGLITFDGLTSSKAMRGTLSCDLSKADLFRLGLTRDSVVASLCGHIDINSDFKHYYKVQGSVSDIAILENGTYYRPDDVVLDILTTRDTTHAAVDCGDFHLRADARGGYEHLLRQTDKLAGELQKQLKGKIIDQVRIRERLPEARIYLTTGRDNFFCGLMRRQGYDLASLFVDLDSSPQTGLNGKVSADSLIVDGIRLDTVRLSLVSDALGMAYHAQVKNGKQHPDYSFNAFVDGAVIQNGTRMQARIYDANDKLGLALGVQGEMERNGIRFHMYGDNPVLGYKTFAVNDSNYVFLGDDRRVSADLKLKAADGMGVQIYTNDENAEALQDVTISLNKFDLEKVLSIIPYAPDLSGVMNGDYHLVMTKDELSVSSDMDIANLVYEQCPMGNLGAEFVYMPRHDGSHYVDGILTHDGKEVASLTGTYRSENGGYLDAELDLEHLPMQFVNGFVPDRILGLRGYGDGTLDVKGSLKAPQVNGEVYLDSCYLYSEPYGMEMRFANDPVRIVGSKLLFENFELYANNEQPLNISGSFDFTNLDRMMLDIRMQARNFQLIDARENPRSEAYGKAFVDFFAIMRGPLESLRMRGRLDVLGNTDMTYVLRDTELARDTQLEELVKFTDFRDTTKVAVVNRPPLTGFDMALSVTVDEGAHIACMLNADHTNYIDQQGGGNLRLTYNTVDDLRLTGRYTLTSGTMKYSLPIIPLKTFTIQNGSYVEFQGDPMNPQLHITATEREKAAVNEGTGTGRLVDFDCGVKLSQTLDKLGLQFIIDAPSDVSIQDELNTMTAEGRSKVAITMLASGMYLADGNTRGFSMNSALSSFLQSEINNVAGNAMRSLGLDLGMSIDNATTSNGGIHTDYNFSFAKRLWNNRLRIIVGGKVSTGAELEYGQTNDSFFDNVELEYRLDQKSSKYLRLFYNNNKYDWLEGMLGEYGVGFKWQRKLRHFRDIFRLKTEEENRVPTAPDTTKVKGK
ncbi:translocation/assembly module TamB domain-containing protein [Prevotella sp. KH2C16]|uniref:translocation/assembly module TamB domain-containing protein n=1 Tax=Prevotella sp. KH2C16 TaxID=1855325 RepID=UPI000B8A1A86|nr:translocation/assembly module TamB domain-containing protein [Prevotella sp. KH2C16]